MPGIILVDASDYTLAQNGLPSSSAFIFAPTMVFMIGKAAQSGRWTLDLADLKVARLVKLLCWNGVGVGLTRKYLVGSTFDVEPSVWPTKAELGDTKYGKGAAAACAKLLAYTS